MSRSSSQIALAGANARFPANRIAGRSVRDSTLLQFNRAGTGSVPMPNIPQMGSVWTELGGAWVKATRGAGATRARAAFSTAARNIRNKIASGG
jgi:maltose-binding protein MalE